MHTGRRTPFIIAYIAEPIGTHTRTLLGRQRLTRVRVHGTRVARTRRWVVVVECDSPGVEKKGHVGADFLAPTRFVSRRPHLDGWLIELLNA